jgi:hypothetical protein
MRYYFISIITVLLFAMPTMEIYAQPDSFYYQKVKDASGNDMLLGNCSRQALLQAPFVHWFQNNYDNYTVDSATCRYIAPLLKDKKITIFLGTWCGDSKREVPRILKMLDCCNFPAGQLNLIMVGSQGDAYKKSPLHEEEGRNIVRVPTIIIEDTGKETGRIVEYPVVSLEKDLLSILRNEKYIPNYSTQRVSAR